MGSGSGSRLSDAIEWIEDKLEPRTLDDGAVEEPRLSHRERKRQFRGLSWVPRQAVSETMPINPPRGSASDFYIPAMAFPRLYRIALVIVMITCAAIPAVFYAGTTLGIFNEFGGKGILIVRDHPIRDFETIPTNIGLLISIMVGSLTAMIVIMRIGTVLGVSIGLARQHLYTLLFAVFLSACFAIVWGLTARHPLAEVIALSSSSEVLEHAKRSIALGASLAVMLLLATACFSYASTLLGKKIGIEGIVPLAGGLAGTALFYLNVEITEFVPWVPKLLIGVGAVLMAVSAVVAGMYRSGVE